MKEPRIRRRSDGRSGSDSSSMAAASCFCNYNERPRRSWLRAKQLRRSHPKCCVGRFRPAWFRSLRGGGVWERCGCAPPPAAATAATTADNDASTPLWRSAGLSPEHHLQSIVWLKQVQPNTCGGKRSTARGKKAGTAHCLVKTEPRPGSDGLTQPRLWDRGGENPRKIKSKTKKQRQQKAETV